nr:copia protein [Tanacetum cinerariifolium]
MFNNMCFFPHGLLVLRILRTLMMMLSLKLRSLSLKSMFFQAVVPRQRNMMTRLGGRLKARVLSLGVRKLIEEFEDFTDNSTNEVNDVSTLVPAVGQNSTNSTNTFSDAGPSNTNVSPTHGESSYMDPSQYPNDADMPALEDITYSNDEEIVGVEADFTNFGNNYNCQNKKDERGIVVRNKAQLVAQGHTQEEGIGYKEVFSPVARIEAIRLFLAYASFMDFMVYQMDVKVNDVTRLQALVDRKNVLIIEETVRKALRLDDAESIDCLPNEETFAEMARMGYEKPSTKLTFYMAFFSSQWKFFIHTILQCMSAKRTTL